MHTDQSVFSRLLQKVNAIATSKKLLKLWNIATTVLVVLVAAVTFLLVGARVVGLQSFTVLSGSMTPAYPVGSLICVRQTDYTQLQTGDVITYMLSEDTVCTHRIVDVIPDEEDSTVVRFSTKGDANEAVDGTLVHYKNILGTPVFTIPYLGYLANYISSPPGTYVAISVGAVFLALVFLPDVFREPYRGKYERLPEQPQERKRRSRNSI